MQYTYCPIFQEVREIDQLIEYNMKNIFLEESYSTDSGETIHRPFSKKSKLEYISGSIA